MDDGELEFSSHELLSNSSFGDLPSSFFDEILNDTHACTHTHTCNPPGPDNSHTHTCYHAHTKIVPAVSEDKDPTDDTAESAENKGKKRPAGNREAVRKYREKKKAKTASLEHEVVKLRAVNQQLMKRLQGQAGLEAEIARLKCLLVDIRGRIEGEIGSFPYQKPANRGGASGNLYQNLSNNPILPGSSSFVMNRCNVQCDDQLYCLRPGEEGKDVNPTSVSGQGFVAYEIENLQCTGRQSSDVPGVGVDRER